MDEIAATFIGKGNWDTDGLFALDGFEKKSGALFFKAHFTDSSLRHMQGLYDGFYPNRELQSEGNFQDNLEQGLWMEYDSSGRKTDSLIYDRGKELVTEKYYYNKSGLMSSDFFYDSVARKGRDTYYADDGLKEKEILVAGDSAVAYYYQDGSVFRSERLKSAKKTEAGFSGGLKSFKDFLEKNLNPDVPVRRHAPPGIYNVVIKFVVDKTGGIADIGAETNFGYGMEEEAIRVIMHSPRWIPATVYGEPVNAYHRQPITFVISGN